MLNLKLDFYK